MARDTSVHPTLRAPPHFPLIDTLMQRGHLLVSLSTHTLLGLLASLLKRHGLTQAQLAAFVALCEARHSGQIIFQVAEGQIRSVEAITSARHHARLLHD